MLHWPRYSGDWVSVVQPTIIGACASDAASWPRRAGGRPRRAYRPTPEEEAKVRQEAHKRYEGYKRLAWTLINQDIVYLRPWQVYAILQQSNLLQARVMPRAHQSAPGKASKPDRVWHIDIMHVLIGADYYYLVDIIDAYSRYLVHWSLHLSLRAETVTQTLQEAFETIDEHTRKELWVVHDNGSQFAGAEWRNFLSGTKFIDIPTRVRHPQSNGMIERLHRTHRQEGIASCAPRTYYEAQDLMPKWRHYYNTERPHSALKYLPPIVYYRGNPEEVLNQREAKLMQAAELRKQYWYNQKHLSNGSNCLFVNRANV